MMFLKVMAETAAAGGATGKIAKKANGAKVSKKTAKSARVKKNTKVGKNIYKKAASMQG